MGGYSADKSTALLRASAYKPSNHLDSHAHVAQGDTAGTSMKVSEKMVPNLVSVDLTGGGNVGVYGPKDGFVFKALYNGAVRQQ